MVYHKLMSKTSFSLKIPSFRTIVLYYAPKMSEEDYVHCVGHVLKLFRKIFDPAPTHHRFREIEVGGRHMNPTCNTC